MKFVDAAYCLLDMLSILLMLFTQYEVKLATNRIYMLSISPLIWFGQIAAQVNPSEKIMH